MNELKFNQRRHENFVQFDLRLKRAWFIYYYVFDCICTNKRLHRFYQYWSSRYTCDVTFASISSMSDWWRRVLSNTIVFDVDVMGEWNMCSRELMMNRENKREQITFEQIRKWFVSKRRKKIWLNKTKMSKTIESFEENSILIVRNLLCREKKRQYFRDSMKSIDRRSIKNFRHAMIDMNSSLRFWCSTCLKQKT